MIEIYSSCCSELFKHLYATIKGANIPCNESADYPRVEISSVTEGECQEKGKSLRSVVVVFDGMSATSLGEALGMMDRVKDAISDADTDFGVFSIIGVIERSLNTMEDFTESQLHLYRIVQNIEFVITEK